jgi:hypothetical protein
VATSEGVTLHKTAPPPQRGQQPVQDVSSGHGRRSACGLQCPPTDTWRPLLCDRGPLPSRSVQLFCWPWASAGWSSPPLWTSVFCRATSQVPRRWPRVMDLNGSSGCGTQRVLAGGLWVLDPDWGGSGGLGWHSSVPKGCCPKPVPMSTQLTLTFSRFPWSLSVGTGSPRDIRAP